MKCIVVNSSVIIALSKLGLLLLLTSLYDKIIIPEHVYREVAITGMGRPGSEELKELVRTKDNVTVLKAKNRKLVESLHDPLGWGESEAIALALEHNCTVGLDDRIARSKAKSLGLNIVGTLGILRKAYDSNLINKNQFMDSIKKLKDLGFRISDTVIRELIEKL